MKTSELKTGRCYLGSAKRFGVSSIRRIVQISEGYIQWQHVCGPLAKSANPTIRISSFATWADQEWECLNVSEASEELESEPKP